MMGTDLPGIDTWGMIMHTSNRFGFFNRALVFITLLYFTSGAAQAFVFHEYFRFTSIADTSEHFFSELNFPCLNDLSRIAFTGTLSSGVDGVFSRVNLGGFDTLADSGSTPYHDFSLDCSINHNAMIEFKALKTVSNGFDTVVLRGTGNSSSPLIDSTGTYDQFSGFQLNLTGKSALGAQRASDNANVILVKGAGTLTGPETVIAPVAGSIALFSNFATNPVINSSGTVAFAAIKNRNGTVHILTVDESGLITELLDDEGPFVGISDVIINDVGSLAFHGTVAGGERGVWRLDQVNGLWNMTQLASSNTSPCVEFDAVAVNDLGATAFSCRDFNSFSYVYLNDQQGLHLILGPGSQLFGRTVASAVIGREAINSDKQVAMLVNFDDDSSAIVRTDATFIPPWLAPILSGALQLEANADVSSNGGGPSVSTPINTRLKLMLLSFDVVFPSKYEGELHVMLGDKLLKSVAATAPGIHQHIMLPIDLRKNSHRAANGFVDQLRFELTGKSGAVAQISNVLIPGVITDSMQADVNKRWHIDSSKGGHVHFVDTTPFPVQVQIVSGDKQKAVSSTHTVSVAILSSEGFDATHDIDRSTLTFNGALLEPEAKQNAAAAHSRCVARDVNADKLPDLVCEVMLVAPAKPAKTETVRVAAMSIHGWNIAGSNATNSTVPTEAAP